MATITERLKWLVEADATSAIRAFDQTGDAAEKNLKKAQTAQQKLGGQLTKVGAGAVAAAGIAGAALINIAGNWEELALKSGQFSDATGIAVDDASRWIEVSKDMGIGADTIEGAIGKMNKTLGASPGLFEDLGIKIATGKGGIEDVNGTFLNVIDTLQGIEDPAARAAAAASIFGKGWQGASELLATSTDDIKARLQSVSDQKVINEDELQKAKNYRDNLDLLSDSVENLGLAIGQEAAPLIGQFAAGLSGAVDWATKADEATGGFTGSLLAGGVAALGMVGAMSLVAGQILKVKGRMHDANGELNWFGANAAPLAVGAGVAMIGFSLHAKAAADRTADLNAAIAGLSTVADPDLMKTFFDILKNGALGSKDAIKELADNNLEGAERLRDHIQAMIDAGDKSKNLQMAVDSLKTAIDNKKDADKQGKETLEKYKTSTDDATVAAEGQAVAEAAAKGAVEDHKDAMEEAKRKSDEFAKSLQGQIDKLAELYPKQYDAVKAKYDYRDAIDDTNTKLGDLNTTLGDNKATQDDVKSATDAARDAIIDQAEKFGGLEGASDGSEGAIRRQIQSLKDQAASLTPGSPLRVFLDQYIADLAAIPSNISTIMDLHISQGSVTTKDGDVIGARGGARASGGPVSAGGTYLVGEEGPELLTMGANGMVTPNDALGGQTINHINITMPVGTNGDDLVRAIKKYEQRNGPGWRSGAGGISGGTP